MVDNFAERINHLIDEVGDGSMTMGTVAQQPYAGAQHNRAYYRHPRGGVAKYLEAPFDASLSQYMERLAFSAVTSEGSNLSTAARENADHMAGLVRRFAPVETGWLRESADAFVYDDGITVYYREGTAPYNFEKE